jgi:hypothetical protein
MEAGHTNNEQKVSTMNEYKEKYDSGLLVWMERIETIVDEQQIAGMMFHLDGSVIQVLITSPFSGFNKADSMNIISRKAYPDGFNSDHGRQRGKTILKQLYLKHKEYAAVVKANEAKESEDLVRTMSNEDPS